MIREGKSVAPVTPVTWSVPDPQYFVGVKDSVLNGTCTESTRTGCQDNDLVDVSTAEVCLIGTGDCGSGTDQVTGVTGATDFPSLINLVAAKDGWYTTLPVSGERVLARPVVFGGLVLFPTFTPSDSMCAATGASALYALYYLTGSAYSSPVVGSTASGTEDYVNRSTGLGLGMTTEAVVHMGAGSGHGRAGICSENSFGQVFQLSINTTGAITSRLLSWRMETD